MSPSWESNGSWSIHEFPNEGYTGYGIVTFTVQSELILQGRRRTETWSSEDLTAVAMESTTTFWGITSCSTLNVNRCFGGTYSFHLQGRIRRVRNQRESSATCWFIAWLILRPLRWRWYAPTKRRLTFNGLRDVISQKMVIFVIHFACGQQYKGIMSCSYTQHRRKLSGRVFVW
jgi:hypothetical protein